MPSSAHGFVGSRAIPFSYAACDSASCSGPRFSSAQARATKARANSGPASVACWRSSSACRYSPASLSASACSVSWMGSLGASAFRRNDSGVSSGGLTAPQTLAQQRSSDVTFNSPLAGRPTLGRHGGGRNDGRRTGAAALDREPRARERTLDQGDPPLRAGRPPRAARGRSRDRIPPLRARADRSRADDPPAPGAGPSAGAHPDDPRSRQPGDDAPRARGAPRPDGERELASATDRAPSPPNDRRDTGGAEDGERRRTEHHDGAVRGAVARGGTLQRDLDAPRERGPDARRRRADGPRGARIPIPLG